MAKQKLELTFFNGLLIGYMLTISTSAILVDKYFVSRKIFDLKKVYTNGKIIRFCEDK